MTSRDFKFPIRLRQYASYKDRTSYVIVEFASEGIGTLRERSGKFCSHLEIGRTYERWSEINSIYPGTDQFRWELDEVEYDPLQNGDTEEDI